jgi:hypothetical protein
MMSTNYVYLLLLDRTGQVGGSVEHSEGKGGESDVAIPRFLGGSTRPCDRVVLAPMASLELCTDRMPGFMGPNKPSSFCNYYVEPHLPASCGTFTFGERMRPRAKTSSSEQGLDFNIVGTCEWLSYVRASRSQAYGVLVKFFPCRVYIDSSRRDTLGYE